MAGTSLLALLDDITSVLDDVSVMTKVAAKKTAGVLGDDLALNAQQVAGVKADRELPVVWAVARGSFVNKLILVPAALAISAVAPWAVTLLLMIGGVYLCYEGFEKLAHRFLHSAAEVQAAHQTLHRALIDPAADLVAYERDKIKGAIRTDFVLSAEIIVITLGTVATAPFGTKLAVLSSIALIMTVGVYGLVAGIVKLDDGGLYLSRMSGTGILRAAMRAMGRTMVSAVPYLMRGLSIVGTAAMFLVGGGILVHNLPALAHAAHAVSQAAVALPGLGATLGVVTSLLLDALAGLIAGGLALGGMLVLQRLHRKFQSRKSIQ